MALLSKTPQPNRATTHKEDGRWGPVRAQHSSSRMRTGWRRFLAVMAWIDDSIVGDLIGAACLGGMFWLGMIAVGVLS